MSQTRDYLVFAAHHGRQIEFDTGELHAVSDEAGFGFVEAFAGFEERFAGNAANAQARPAECRFALRGRDVQPKLRSANCGYVSARSCTDNDQIMFGSRHDVRLRSTCGRGSRSRP